MRRLLTEAQIELHKRKAENMTGVQKFEPKEFKKFDSGKLEYDMFPNSVLEGIIKVMMYGAYTKGYEKNNWKKCEDTTRYYNAQRRHQEARMAGEYTDPESGLPHIFHELCNGVFIAYLEEEKRKENGTSAS